MNIRPIRSNTDHKHAVAHLMALLESDPAPDTDEEAELEVLTTLIEKYETEHFPIEAPSPVEAIRFRMDQQGLKNKDLVPYFGSASKASEVLNGKRPLSLVMIRKLHQHLGIPADVLVQPPTPDNSVDSVLDPSTFPVKEMHQRGYFSTAPTNWTDAKRQVEGYLRKFMCQAGIDGVSPAYCRSTAHYRQGKILDEAALLAWQARVLIRSYERDTPPYVAATVTTAFMDRVAALSVLDDGPRSAREFLEKHGIVVMIEPHLSKTYLDGAAFLREDGVPVIGLTLRHDKLDNFWFTLMHELVHVSRHLSPDRRIIFDDLSQEAHDDIEREADAQAAEILIPESQWQSSAVRHTHGKAAAEEFARSLQRHPAIVVGRLQHETSNFRMLAKSPGVGRGQTRCCFSEFANGGSAYEKNREGCEDF